MPIGYRCDRSHGCTFVVWDGDIDPNEWRAHVERLFNDPAFPPGPRLLADLRTAGGAPSITDDAEREMAGRWSSFARKLPSMQLALIPNGGWEKAQRVVDERITATHLRFILFNDVYGASLWLGLDASEVTRVLDEIHTELRDASGG